MYVHTYVFNSFLLQNSPFSNFFSDVKPFSDQLQKVIGMMYICVSNVSGCCDCLQALEFQNKHFLESCAREKELVRNSCTYHGLLGCMP